MKRAFGDLKRWLISLGSAMATAILALTYTGGDLNRCSLLVPSALVSNLIVSGGPDGSGAPGFWIITFLVVTIALWTIVWYVIISVAVLLSALFNRPGFRRSRISNRS